jgi:hypothetical protein
MYTFYVKSVLSVDIRLPAGQLSVDIRLPAGQLRYRGSISGTRKILFSPPRHPDPLQGLPSLIPTGYQGLFYPKVKCSGREADHSWASGAEAILPMASRRGQRQIYFKCSWSLCTEAL